MSRRPFLALQILCVCALATSCSDRLTPARAATVIRHSGAFLSGIPESQPVLDGVSALRNSERAGSEADSCVADFTYHWPGQEGNQTLMGSVVLRRSPNGWAVDDVQSRALTPSWPQLPKTQSSFFPQPRKEHP